MPLCSLTGHLGDRAAWTAGDGRAQQCARVIAVRLWSHLLGAGRAAVSGDSLGPEPLGAVEEAPLSLGPVPLRGAPHTTPESLVQGPGLSQKRSGVWGRRGEMHVFSVCAPKHVATSRQFQECPHGGAGGTAGPLVARRLRSVPPAEQITSLRRPRPLPSPREAREFPQNPAPRQIQAQDAAALGRPLVPGTGRGVIRTNLPEVRPSWRLQSPSRCCESAGVPGTKNHAPPCTLLPGPLRHGGTAHPRPQPNHPLRELRGSRGPRGVE